MTSVSHSIPPEILDLFIDELAQSSDKSVSRAALHACSLVSPAFCRRAQHHLLSEINLTKSRFEDTSRILRRTNNLKAILDCGLALRPLPQASSALACRIRSFKLMLNGTTDEIHRILDCPELAGIISLLHGQNHGIRTFGLVVDYPIMQVNWSNIEEPFQKAFLKLLSSSFLSTLHLRNITGVPTSLLRGTSIKNIYFKFLQFKESLPLCGMVPHDKLEIVHIDPSFSLRSLLMPDEDSSEPKTTFDLSLSHVKELRYTVHMSSTFQSYIQPIMGAFNSLEILKLECLEVPRESFGSLNWNIPYSDLPSMHSLTVYLRGVTFHGKRDLLMDLITLLSPRSTPRALRTLQIELSVRSNHPWNTRNEFFPNHKLWTHIDHVLNNERFGSVRLVNLNLEYHIVGRNLYTFNEDLFRSRCQRFGKQVFPSITSSSPTKNLAIYVRPYFWS